MKKHLILLSLLALGLLASCNKTKPIEPVQTQLQLVCDGANFEVAGIPVTLQDAEATFTLEATTNSLGQVSFTLNPGSYQASCTYVTAEAGQRQAFSGTTGSFLVVEATPATQILNLQKVESQQIVIKELYFGGCTNPVTIPPYSQIVVALFGAIDHTATVSTSVNLANANYYWMSNSDVAAYTNTKYTAADVIPSSHYLSCQPFTQGNAWALSNSSPAVFIGNAPKAQVQALCADTENYDHTMGDKPAFNVVKFPKANVIGALEVYSQPNLSKSNPRFPTAINSGYVAITNNQGYTVYRNVDKQATEALPENEGKLVYNYSMGTVDVEGTTDPSGIDAEASIANGAHIIYSFTKNTTNDFHQRKESSLK